MPELVPATMDAIARRQGVDRPDAAARHGLSGMEGLIGAPVNDIRGVSVAVVRGRFFDGADALRRATARQQREPVL